MCDLPRPLSGEGSHPLAWLVELLPVKRKLSERQSHFVSLLRGLLPDPKAAPPRGGATSDAQGLT